MKQEILDIINNNPKTYHTIIKKDKDMLDWVENNTLSASNHFKTKLYSAIYHISDICPYGSQLTVHRWVNGFKRCGPASVCNCTQTKISNSMKSACKNRSSAEQELINQKRKSTMLKKYGVEYNSQRDDFPVRIQIDKSIFDLLSSKQWLEHEYVAKARSALDIASELNVDYSTVLFYCQKHKFDIRQYTHTSKKESQIKTYIETLGFDIVQSDRSLLDGKEIDLWIPEKNLAIEVNGLYWHSYHPSLNKLESLVKYNHLNKTKLSQEKNIQLLHITDFEWRNKPDIVKSIILSKLLTNIKVYARKCCISVIDTGTARNFLNKYHIQGFIGSHLYVGLFHNNDLVMVGSAGSNRFIKNSIELHRLSTVSNTTVVGGASKIVKYISNYYKSPIISYCDRSKSNGNVYQSIGFKKIKETKPNYFWTDGTNIISRQKTVKSSLENWLPSYDPSLSQTENMFAAGFRRYWDCGNFVFLYK